MGITNLRDAILRRMGELDMSTVELARQSGVSRAELYKIVGCEVQDVSIHTLRRLSRALRVNNAWLISRLYSDYLRPVHRELRLEKYALYDSGWVGEDPADNIHVSTNQRFKKTWQIQNVGRGTWSGFSLVNIDDPTIRNYLKPDEVAIPLPDVAPGDTATIEVMFTAPKYAGTVESHWKLIDQDGVIVFPGQEGIWCQVAVDEL